MAGRYQGPTRGPLLDFEDEEDTQTVEDGDDRAIALALSLCTPGETVVVHEDDCSVEDNGEGCDCVCVTLVAGAQA